MGVSRGLTQSIRALDDFPPPPKRLPNMLKSPIRPLLVRRLAPRPDTSGSAGRWQGSAAGGKQCKIVWVRTR